MGVCECGGGGGAEAERRFQLRSPFSLKGLDALLQLALLLLYVGSNPFGLEGEGERVRMCVSLVRVVELRVYVCVRVRVRVFVCVLRYSGSNYSRLEGKGKGGYGMMSEHGVCACEVGTGGSCVRMCGHGGWVVRAGGGEGDQGDAPKKLSGCDAHGTTEGGQQRARLP